MKKEFKTLLGHKNLDFSIECLQSFVHNCSEKISLAIFEDGSLDQDDISKLKASFEDVTIVQKNARDAIVAEKLKHYPNCQRYRDNTIYAYKIFDMMLYDNDNLLYIDSDILFIKKFELPGFDDVPTFMLDSISAYSFSPSEFFYINFPIYPKVNTGLFFFPKKHFDLAYIEFLLQEPTINKGFIRGIPWLEQTIWSFLASKNHKVNYFNPSQIVMATEKLTIDSSTVAVHLVSTYRGHFSELKVLPRQIDTTAARITLTSPRSVLHKSDYLYERVIRKAKRMVKL